MSNQTYQQSDLLLVNRGADSHTSMYGDVKANILDSHLIQSPTPPDLTTYPDLVAGTIWIDISQVPPVVNIWDGSTWNPIEGGGSNIAEPDPTDVTFNPPVPGNGTQADPFVLSTVTSYTVGGTAETAETITISNQEPMALVIIEALSGGVRFEQQMGFCDSAGSWTGKFYYLDTPDSTSGETYEAKFKIGTETGVFVDWEVIQVVNQTPIVGGDGTTTAPNASPPSVENDVDKLYGTGKGTWADGAGTLRSIPTATRAGVLNDSILFGVNGGSIDKTDKAITDGQEIEVIFDGTVVDTANDGDTISGALTNDDGFYQEWSMVKDTVANAWSIDPLIDQPLNDTVQSTNVVIEGINAQSEVDMVFNSETLANVMVSVDGAAFTAAFPVSFNPGDTLQFQGDTGGDTDTEYVATFSVGGTEATWSVTTVDVEATIVQPTITSPLNGAADLVPDITLVSSAYDDASTGAGAHTSSTWEVYESETKTQVKTSEIISAVEEGGGDVEGWSAIESPGVPNAGTGIATDGAGVWIMCGSPSGAFSRSLDNGDTWNVTAQPPSPLGFPSAIAYGDGKFVAVNKDTGSSNYSVVISKDKGLTWEKGQPVDTGIPYSGTFSGVAYGNGRWGIWCSRVSGHGNSFYYSADGENWTPVNTDNQGIDITKQYSNLATDGNGTWVTGTAQGKIVYSTDNGGNWSTTTTPATDCTWNGITYGGGKWIAVSERGNKRVAYSPDGINWTMTNAASAEKWRFVTYGAGKFVAGGEDETGAKKELMYSDDGIQWSSIDTPLAGVVEPAGARDLVAGAWGKGRFVVIPNTTTHVAVSEWSGPPKLTLTFTDEKALNAVSEDEVGTINQKFKSGNTIVAESDSNITGVLDADADDSGPTMTLSTFTAGWAVGLSAVNEAEEIAFPAPSTEPPDPAIYTQVVDEVDDTSNLTSYDLDDTVLQSAKAYHSRVKYKDDTAPDAIESEWSPYHTLTTATSDITTWYPADAAAALDWEDITYGNGVFVAVATNNTTETIMYSSDGIDWDTATLPAAGTFYGVGYGEPSGVPTFVAVGYGVAGQEIMYSTDNGVTWTGTSAPAGVTYKSWYGVTYGNGRFVAVSSGGDGAGAGKTIYSTDGITWSAGDDLPLVRWRDVTFGDGKFVAIADQGNVGSWATSTDGATWNATTYGSGRRYRLAHGNGTFVNVGYAEAYVSTNGENWTTKNFGSPRTPMYGVAFGNGYFVAVATGSADGKEVIYSTDNGATWEREDGTGFDSMRAIAYGGGKFVAVANGGSQRVMYALV